MINEPLVDRDSILLPSLHIKLGLMKQFVKALDKNGDCFRYIRSRFPGTSYEKVRAGIFDGPQIRTLIRDPAFVSHRTIVEFAAWSSSSFYGRVPHFQMLAVMVLSQHCVSTSKTVSPRIPVGARCTGHVRMMCSAVCSAAPHSQFDVGARPHLCMND